MTAEGTVEQQGEGKTGQLGCCFMVKKTSEGLGYCPVDVSVRVGDHPFMQVYVVSKKTIHGLKLFLQKENS